MGGMQASDTTFAGLGGVSGFQAGSHDIGGYDANSFAFDGIHAGELSAATTISPNSSNLMPSTLPTPASGVASEQRSAKKRPAPENDYSGRTTSPQSESSSDPADKVVKRQRNTEAARRYRQRKVDRATELEEALAAMTKQRDDFQLKLARSEAEVEVLRRLVGKGT